MSRLWREERGQAAVEFVGLMPMFILFGMIGVQLLMFGMAQVAADHAAEAGALAVAQDRDPKTAVRDAAPLWSKKRLVKSRVVKNNEAVIVTVKPPVILPWLGKKLQGRSEAYVGKE